MKETAAWRTTPSDYMGGWSGWIHLPCAIESSGRAAMLRTLYAVSAIPFMCVLTGFCRRVAGSSH